MTPLPTLGAIVAMFGADCPVTAIGGSSLSPTRSTVTFTFEHKTWWLWRGMKGQKG